MPRRRLAALGAALAVAAGLTTATGPSSAAGGAPVPPAESATPHRVAVAVRVSRYPVYDARGRRRGVAAWRVSPAGGNCCETYLSATPTGRLVESGGTYPWYTDDHGQHWFRVTFDVPDQNDNGKVIAGGEGATVVGPGGDVYGVTWDAYSGDHLQAYRYRARTNTWRVAQVVVKTPFYDRPWLTFAAGEFALDGVRSGRMLDVSGGGVTKDVDTLSADGLDYRHASDPYFDESRSATGRATIRVVSNPAADWWQPYPGASTLPLTGGGLLRMNTVEDVTASHGCPVARLVASSATWQCVRTPAHFRGSVRQDSRGELVEVYPAGQGTALVVATSRDGGVRWSTTRVRPPPGAGATLEEPDFFTVVANGRLRQAVVSARFDDSRGAGHDVVFRVDTSGARPRLMTAYLVGRGDITTKNDVSGSTGYRFDYPSVALLPDGRVAVSFDDSTCLQPTTRDPRHRSPEVAILL